MNKVTQDDSTEIKELGFEFSLGIRPMFLMATLMASHSRMTCIHALHKYLLCIYYYVLALECHGQDAHLRRYLPEAGNLLKGSSNLSKHQNHLACMQRIQIS